MIPFLKKHQRVIIVTILVLITIGIIGSLFSSGVENPLVKYITESSHR